MAELEYKVQIKLTKWFKIFTLCLSLPPFLFSGVLWVLRVINPVVVKEHNKPLIRFNDLLR